MPRRALREDCAVDSNLKGCVSIQTAKPRKQATYVALQNPRGCFRLFRRRSAEMYSPCDLTVRLLRCGLSVSNRVLGYKISMPMLSGRTTNSPRFTKSRRDNLPHSIDLWTHSFGTNFPYVHRTKSLPLLNPSLRPHPARPSLALLARELCDLAAEPPHFLL